MSKRNITWLIIVVVVGVVVTTTAGFLWGLLAAAVTLAVSEVIERQVRKKRRAGRGVTDAPSFKDAISSRRKQR